MPTAKRRHHLSVIQRLLNEPHRFDLIQAQHIIDLWLRRNGQPNDATLPYMVRFQNSISMNFAPSQIEALAPIAHAPIGSDQALQKAYENGQLRHISITPAHKGFFGANGVMAYCFTDHLARHYHVRKYDGSRAFFDIFFNRLMVLDYQAWSKYRIHYRLDANGRDALLPMQLALAGLQTRPTPAALADTTDGSAVDNEVGAYYAAMLRHRPVSSRIVAGVLSEYFDVPVRLEQFVETWDILADNEVCKLGVQNTGLGKGAVVGVRCRERHSRVRIRIGPLARIDFDRFLPDANAHRALKRVLALFSLPAVDFDLRLILRAADVQPVRLKAPCDARLGMGVFLVTKHATADREDSLFALRC
jgi:type VI secretion system protein ImpH